MGLSTPRLLALAGITEQDLLLGADQISDLAFGKLWKIAIEELNSPFLPFYVGRQLYIEQLGMLGFILRNCSNLGEALVRLEKYNRITNDFIEFSHSLMEDQVQIQFEMKKGLDPEFQRQIILLEFGFLSGGIPQLIAKELKPSMMVTCLNDHDKSFLTDQFQCIIGYNIAVNTFAIETRELQSPIALPDQSLRLQLEQLADAELEKYGPISPWTNKVRGLIVKTMDGEKLSIDKVADQLNLSVRVLQRKLQDEGTTYQNISDQTRRDMAMRYLEQNYPMNEVAYLLGFEVPSAFSRAFKGWTGYSPQVYNNQVH
jgi:AraC-like DNA-binding protein